MSKYSNLAGGMPRAGFQGYGMPSHMVDLNDGMDMADYGEDIEYYDEEMENSDEFYQQYF